MIQKLIISLLLVLVLPISSCKKVTDSDELKVSLSKQANLVFSAIQSCEDEIAGDITKKSLEANAARFSKVTFTWSGKDAMEITDMKAIFKGANLEGGQKEVSFDVTGISFAKGGGQPEITSSCSLRVGGFKVSDANVASTFRGTMKIRGLAIDSDGNQRNVSTEVDLQLNYNP